MNATALPAAALEHAPDRLGEAHMGVTDHQLDPSEAALFERTNEDLPAALAFAVSHLQAEQFTAAVGIDAHRDHGSPGADLQGPAQPPLEADGIEVDVGVAAALQGPIQEGRHP